MRFQILLGLLLTFNLCVVYGADVQLNDVEWLKKAQHVDDNAIEWLKVHLKERLSSENMLKNPLEEDLKSGSTVECKNCGFASQSLDETAALYVFMSFSLEDKLWIQFSQELERIGGVFVVRGPPQNSFKELANRIFDLQEKGVNAPIQIHPTLFKECEVQLVPTIAVIEGHRYDKIAGNLSIKHALEKMGSQGETSEARSLYRKYWEKS